jgi:hypothetical protein
MNRAQYQLSKRQAKRARRRAERGLPPVEAIPMGPRVANAAGRPSQRYRNDQLSASYRRGRAAQVAEAAAATQARRDHARRVAADLVAVHGTRLVVEDAPITAWSRHWGAAVAAFSPGALVAAIDREGRAVGALACGRGGIERAATRPTALSQHCPCGARVAKVLGDRVHACGACGLRGNRDAVAAVLASFVVFGEPGQPTTARVDYPATAATLPAIRAALSKSSFSGWQDTLSESTDLSAREGSSLTWPMSTPDAALRIVVARRIVGWAPCPTLDETGGHRTTPDRARMRANRLPTYDLPSYFRDSS